VAVYRVWCLYRLALLAHARGDLAEAERGYQQVFGLTRPAGMSREELLAYGGFVDVSIDRGDLDQARQTLQQAELLLQARPHSGYVVLVRRARLARIAGTVEQIPELLAEAEAALDPEELLLERVIWYVESGHAALRAGDSDRATGILDRAEEHARHVGLVIWLGESRRITALRADLAAATRACRPTSPQPNHAELHPPS
jgi:ATP/maltotriose-dependent transcriptional regulator MalT